MVTTTWGMLTNTNNTVTRISKQSGESFHQSRFNLYALENLTQVEYIQKIPAKCAYEQAVYDEKPQTDTQVFGGSTVCENANTEGWDK